MYFDVKINKREIPTISRLKSLIVFVRKYAKKQFIEQKSKAMKT